MQTTAATSTGHTDLLSGILKVQVRNEEKITEQDRIYCQNQQDELYKTLDQIAWWYNIFKREAEKYEGKIKLKHEPNGKITVSSYELHYRHNNDEKDYTHHEFTPFNNINELVDSRHSAVQVIQFSPGAITPSWVPRQAAQPGETSVAPAAIRSWR